MFTWSFGWASSPARLAITSFAFMFDEVPEPVWKTSTGNWSSCLPSPISSPAFAIFSAMPLSSSPSSALARAAAAFSRPSQWITGAGIGWPEILKFSTAFVVSPPQSWSAMAQNLSSRTRARPRSPAEGPLELRREQVRVLGAEARGRVQPPDQVGVDPLRAPLDRADQVAELDGRIARSGPRAPRR